MDDKNDNSMQELCMNGPEDEFDLQNSSWREDKERKLVNHK